VPRPSDHSFPFRIEFPPELPISARAEEITAAIQAHSVIILAGETGSGKTTQIPKMCLAAGRGTQGRIACTQPRRVAALSVSRRVAEELGVQWGREVGSKIRFNDETTSQTVVKFLTDGMLLAEVQGDPLLREYDTIIIDEAHERSLNIDFLLGHLRTLRYKRPELKVIVTSATIDTEAFSKAFDDAPIIQVEGRTYPVEVIYAPLDSLGSDAAEGDEREARAEALHYIDGTTEAVERIVRESMSGDILVFLPSERDIREVQELIEGRRLRDCEVVPLFGRLSNAEQQRVFAPSQRRKIVLATNIAETSLTIPGIRFVVDPGLARVSRYSPQARTRRLPIEPVSQSSADQRKGRSGRVADGVCIRLYSEKDFLERPRFTQPEIQRANLADVILRMKAFGLGDIERFPFINMPAGKSIRAGYTLLEELGALETEGKARATEPDPATPASAEDSPYLRQLTPVGRELARLPVDPTVGRMILQARSEKAVREVLVIAAGLSVQDPRERPLEKQQQADAAHRRFVHPDSDFLTLLNVWDTYHEEFENLSQGRLRRFCRDHFLSYTRMREWRDVYTQLLDVLKERKDFRFTSAYDGLKTVDDKSTAFGSPPFRAIHRSILAGLLGNIAHFDEENGNYKATNDRRVSLFPGSVLFRREEPRRPRENESAGDGRKKAVKPPKWIMAAEIMETSRLFARTCARLDPLWALEIGAHVVRVAHSEPFWNADAGRVMVKQRTRLYGLELESRGVGYGKIDPVHATEIFIREALVNDSVTFPLDFLSHNRRVRENVEAILTRTRDTGYLNLDEAAYRYYAHYLLSVESSALPGPPATRENRPIEGISSVPELIDLVRTRRITDPQFLMMAPDDLRDPEALTHDSEAFPAELPIENRAIPLNYAYKPGQTDDGVTLDVNIREAADLTPAALDWAVPGHLEPKVEHYIRVLPKELRRSLVPLAETARQLSAQLIQRDRLTGRRETLIEALAFQIAERFRVAIDPSLWSDKPPPEHLRVRVRVLDDRGRELCASRELAEIRLALGAHQREASSAVARVEPEAWRKARARWEKPAQTNWAFGDIPSRVLVTEQAGVPVHAFPALNVEKEGVALRLFKTPEEAEAVMPRGLSQLLEMQLGRDLGWLQRDLRSLRNLGPLTATLVPMEELQEHAAELLREWLCDPRHVRPAQRPTLAAERHPATTTANPKLYSESMFGVALAQARANLPGLVPRFVEQLREILSVRQSLLVHPHPYPKLDDDLGRLVPPDFLRTTSFDQLAHFPRYLKAMKFRADRWKQNPLKDSERAAQLAPYGAALNHLTKLRPAPAARTMGKLTTTSPEMIGPPPAALTAFRWLVEEYRVSVFAQELGTAEPVSPVKLDRALAELSIGTTLGAGGPPRREPEPAAYRPMIVAPEKKAAPLKNFGALDRLFPK
jgi:ATP-dependent helicase HrpA